MRRLLDVSIPGAQARDKFPTWGTIDRALDKSWRLVRHYYQSNARSVPSSHVLVRLLETLGMYHHLDDQALFDRVTDIAYDHASAHHLPSPTSFGRPLSKGVFYGEKVTEILAVCNDVCDVAQESKAWQDIEAVKVYRHPLTDLDFTLPNAKLPYHDHTGTAVLTVDLPRLALQYRYWSRQNARRDPPLRVENFIAMVVLPNMLKRQINLCLANRIFETFKKNAPPAAVHANPMTIPKVDHMVDAVAKDYIANIALQSYTFDTMLRSLPQFEHGDYRELVQPPEGPVTQPIGWVWLIAQLPMIEFLVNTNHGQGGTRNQSYIRNIRLGLLEYASSHVLERTLTPDLLDEVVSTIRMNVIPYLHN